MRDLLRSSRHIFWRPRQDCVMPASEVEKVEMPSSGDSDTDEWLKMEGRFRGEGQAYGLKGLDL